MMHRIGAFFYGLWGLLHLAAALSGVQLAMSQSDGLVQGRLLQNAWNLGVFSLIAIGVAVFLNWRNSRTGYWANLIIVSAADIGFVLFVLVPGLIPLWPGILGPVFWLLGLAFTTLGLRSAPKRG
jgi:hypothetical protein